MNWKVEDEAEEGRACQLVMRAQATLVISLVDLDRLVNPHIQSGPPGFLHVGPLEGP